MKIDWRVSAIAAGSAFFLSVLVGVIGNVSFGMLILRATIAAALFGAGAIGLTIIIDRFLPELRGAASATAASPDGNSVDIVVEGGDEFDTVMSGMNERDEELDAADTGVENDVAGLQADDSGELLEEVDESDGIGEGASVETADELEEVEEEDEDEPSSDALPSVDSMSDSFTEVPIGEDPVSDVPDSGGDPSLMAQAIRTVLKREE
jgi:hypothetical protein